MYIYIELEWVHNHSRFGVHAEGPWFRYVVTIWEEEEEKRSMVHPMACPHHGSPSGPCSSLSWWSLGRKVRIIRQGSRRKHSEASEVGQLSSTQRHLTSQNLRVFWKLPHCRVHAQEPGLGLECHLQLLHPRRCILPRHRSSLEPGMTHQTHHKTFKSLPR